jgi:chemotaxis protein MotB
MAKKDKKDESSGGGAPMWMVTYGDMMSLLLTFFVLILSFSSIQEAGFKQAMGSLKGALGILGAHDYIINLGKIMIPESTYAVLTRHSMQTTGDISKKLNFVSEYENVEVYRDNRGINIILPANVLFNAGDDAIKDEAMPLLRKIGAFLFDLKDNEFLIVGHTDDSPISTLRFPSNWHLSTARAISIAQFLHRVCGIENTRLTVAGRGEFEPVAPNDTEENREKNRRVGILIES